MAEPEKLPVRGDTFQERSVRLDERLRVEEEAAETAEVAGVKERALLALVITAIVAVTFLLPFLALIIGLAWRILRWAAGY